MAIIRHCELELVEGEAISLEVIQNCRLCTNKFGLNFNPPAGGKVEARRPPPAALPLFFARAILNQEIN